MVEIPLDEYLEMANQAYVVAYVTAVCATILLYDYVLTLREEITRMWSLRFSITKCLFLINRYVVIPMVVFNGIASTRTHLPEKFCVFYLRWLTVCVTVTIATTEGILLTRVWALYKDNKPVLGLAFSLYLAGVITLVGLTLRDFVGEQVHIVQDFSSLPGCYAASVPALIVGYWITPVVIESVLFVLVVWRAFAWRRNQWSVPPELVLMARDSTVYFCVIFVLLSVNLFVFEYAPPFLSSLFVTPSSTAGCIAGSRLLLNLRRLSDPERTEFETSNMTAGVRFVVKPHLSAVTKSFQSRGTSCTVDPTVEEGSIRLGSNVQLRTVQQV